MARTDLIDARRQRAVRLPLLAIGAALVIARIVMWAMAPATATGAVQWVPLEKAVEQSRLTGKPIMFDFTAEWCPPCHRLDAEVFKAKQYASAINERFVPVRVVDRKNEDGANKPNVQQLQDRYRIRSFPTVVFAETGGAEIGRMEGFRSARHFARVMESVR